MGVRSGKGYREALRDGRTVWHAGRRIADVTTHPGFAGTVRTLASLYDLQSQPDCAEVMTAEWEGERISCGYLPPRTHQDILHKRENVELWARHTFGQMGRFPEFCAELLVGLLDFVDTLGRRDPTWAANARAYFEHCTRNDLCLTHALTDQFYDRTRRASEQEDPDLILHVVRETSAGPVVRGLRTLATLAPLADEALVYPNRPRDPDEADYAIAFALPMNAPGLKIVCRDLYAAHADAERLPLTTRFDEVDAALIFDDVVVPWERVFVYRDPALAAAFHGIHTWSAYSTVVRLIVKLEMFLGVGQLLTRWANRHTSTASQILLARFIQDIEILRACVQTAETNAVRTPSGFLAPQIATSYRLYGIEAADRAERALEDVLTSYLILTGGASDLADAEIGPLVQRYFRGGAPSTRDHLRTIAVAADMVVSAFGKRGQLYERLQSGEADRMRQRVYAQYTDTSAAERVQRFVREMGPEPPASEREGD